MRQSFTGVLERNATFTPDFATEPYEADWAGEARWFIRVLERRGEGVALRDFAQVSPDGVHWCDQDGLSMVIRDEGLASFAVRDFGGWLRLRCVLAGDDPAVKLTITMALKE